VEGNLRPVALPIGRPGHRAVRPGRWAAPRPAALLGLLAIVVLALLVLNPLLRLAIASFQSPETGALTVDNYRIAYGARGIRALLTSLLYSGAATLVAALFALPIAWAMSRTDMPGKTTVRALIFGAFITPSYLGAVGWILLAGPNAGWINRVWMALTGSPTGIVDIYGFSGLVFVTALYGFPYIFVFTVDALDLVSTEIEDAARILGAGALRTAFHVTLPMVAPAILGGAIICFLDTIALFGTPAIIALPARINVMTLELWQFFEFPVRAEAAAAYAIPLILITCLLFGAQRLYLGARGHTALTGKGAGRQPANAGAWRWVLLGYAVLVCALAVVLPFAALTKAAFSKAWGRGFALDNLTLGNFEYLLFEQVNAQQSMLHSFTYSAATACIAVGLGLAVAYMVSRRLVRFGNLLTLLATAPFVIPGIVLAIGFYAAYAPPPFSLYGTGAILVLAFTTRFLPIAYVNCLAALRAISPELEEAARILGGGPLRALAGIVAPLLKRSLAGCWLLIFIPATRELSTAIFLVGAKTRVIAVMLLDLSEDGSFETLAALGLILLVATVLIALLGYRLIGRDLLLRKA
jgi:iron(III) transport system permease protein